MTRWLRSMHDLGGGVVLWMVAEFPDIPEQALFDAGWRQLPDTMTEDEIRQRYKVPEIARVTRFDRVALQRLGLEL
jgi:hypothetical protein